MLEIFTETNNGAHVDINLIITGTNLLVSYNSLAQLVATSRDL